MPKLGKTRHENLPPAALYEHAIAKDEGVLAANGPLVVRTGKHTGRSPKDKFIVDEPDAHEGVWWGGFNTPITQEKYDALRQRFMDHMNEREVFVQDAFVGADPRYRRSVRAYTESAWASIFVDNLFIRPTEDDLKDFVPNFTIIDAPTFKADPERDGTRSETVILVNLAKQEIFIGGTEYAGEIKKGAFGIMNYRLPAEGVLPMHSSVNVGKDGDVAIFFGLSGTGKTTLSADPDRTLIGDDEHGWSDQGVFNVEGGCYAKVIRLSADGEPEIFRTTRTFGTVLENVVCDPESRQIDLDSDKLTENTRSSYPLTQLHNVDLGGQAGHPRNVVFLTCDAFGVLPPISRLTPEQAMYHFLSGYTAKVAGTERGVTEPKVTFSACFGSPFLPLHPGVYAKMLGENLAQHNVRVWLLNTGWTGGPYGTGQRIKLGFTRRMVTAALTGELDGVDTWTDPIFGLAVPTHIEGVPDKLLHPRETWQSPAEYDAKASKLADLFAENFKKYESGVTEEVKAAGPSQVRA